MHMRAVRPIVIASFAIGSGAVGQTDDKRSANSGAALELALSDDYLNGGYYTGGGLLGARFAL